MKFRTSFTLLLLASLLAALLGLVRVPSAHAQTTITVSTCDEMTLDNAIKQANSDNNGDMISFSCSGDITLNSTLNISGSMIIDGSGQGVTLDGQNQVQVLTVNSGVTFNLKALTVAHGVGAFDPNTGNYLGGGLLNNGGTVNISNSTFSGNSAGNNYGIGFGGGLFNAGGTVNISNSTFSGNPANFGGGLSNHGTVNISNSTFSGNSAGIGGGLSNHGTVNISNSTFSGNSGGGLDNEVGTMSISNSTFSKNSTGYGGGGLSNHGTVSISNSTFATNSATDGGGLSNTGTVSITNSTFATNSATGSLGVGSGLDNNGGSVSITNSIFATNNSATFGGGLDNNGGTVNIGNSTFATNSAGYGGGLGNESGTVSVSNSTFSGNSAGSSGGGLDNTGTVSITNSTFATNSAGYGGGLGNGYKMNIGESIVANNTGGNCLGGVSDQGYNLESATDCSFTGTGDLQNTDPKLDSNGLQKNGGPTQTIALQATSPAIDHIPAASCPATDQRGVSRLPGERCDIGAFEFPDTTTPTLTLPGTITVNATSPQGAVVPYTASAIDDDGDSLTASMSCTDTSGHSYPTGSNVSATFPIGTTSVNCSASEPGSNPASGSFQVVVNDTDLGLTNMPSNITNTATSPQGAVVTYTLPTAVDEDSSAPAVSCTPVSGSTFPIGTTTVTCTAADSDDTPGTVSGSFQMVVKPMLTASGTSVSPVEGSAFSGPVATGTDDGAGTLSATISWGDGSSSTGNVSLNADGSYSVMGSHTYAEEGSFDLTVQVSASGGQSATATGKAAVTDAPLTITRLVAGAGEKRLAGLAATFTDADPAGTVSDYSATISWGDGATSSGLVAKNPLEAGFVMAGAHQYAKEGTYSVTVTLHDGGGSTITGTHTLVVP